MVFVISSAGLFLNIQNAWPFFNLAHLFSLFRMCQTIPDWEVSMVVSRILLQIRDF